MNNMDIQAQLDTVETKLHMASEAYKSGQVASRPALAKVKRLIREKLALQEKIRTA